MPVVIYNLQPLTKEPKPASSASDKRTKAWRDEEDDASGNSQSLASRQADYSLSSLFVVISKVHERGYCTLRQICCSCSGLPFMILSHTLIFFVKYYYWLKRKFSSSPRKASGLWSRKRRVMNSFMEESICTYGKKVRCNNFIECVSVVWQHKLWGSRSRQQLSALAP